MILSKCLTLLNAPILSRYPCRAVALKPYLRAARWIPLAINPYTNLTAVFLSAMQEDPEDEDIREPSEMYVYPCFYMKMSTEIAYSDKKEELKVFEDILKLVPSFKHVLGAPTSFT
jgi:hypothetical protein